MKIFEGFKFLFFSRGITRWIRRVISINRRFSFTPYKQMAIIKEYAACLKSHGVRGNFFIPAVLLDRYAMHLNEIDSKTIEWGIHGLVHTDHSQLKYEEQRVQITKAVAIFDKHGFDFKGFRCPYLRYNHHTRDVLKSIGRFKFDSSSSLVWDQVYDDGHKYYPWIKTFYGAQVYVTNLARPQGRGQLIEIPVSLPDDDITLDRERFSNPEILRIWSVMLETCHRNKEVFLLQLHPERFLELKDVLVELIKKAKALRPSMWITTLSDVAEWQKKNPSGTWPEPHQGAFCISGDIDAITIKDFFSRIKEW